MGGVRALPPPPAPLLHILARGQARSLHPVHQVRKTSFKVVVVAAVAAAEAGVAAAGGGNGGGDAAAAALWRRCFCAVVSDLVHVVALTSLDFKALTDWHLPLSFQDVLLLLPQGRPRRRGCLRRREGQDAGEGQQRPAQRRGGPGAEEITVMKWAR